ncbi:hypothetical protein ACFYM2_31350 [Streptomyces sp. NPDC006711]|uniref:hypothetical protein n=1 Tax=Streptomyces sp. NPDC006711 TaxID=3364762 RepID=UPI00369758DB
MSKSSKEAAEGLVRLEGFLMSEAVRRDAHEQGQDFARALTWLGPAEQRDVSSRFARHHLRLHRDMLAATVVRADKLRAEYAHRYAQLRRRLICLTLLAFALCAGISYLRCLR